MPGSGERRPRPRGACAKAAALLPELAAGDAVPEVLERHVSTCLRCQADLARYRRLRRTLRGFGGTGVEPGPQVLPAILVALERAEAHRALHPAQRAARAHGPQGARRGAYVGGVAVATAGAAAGVLVWVARRRPSLAG